jgi:hypothetical protein
MRGRFAAITIGRECDGPHGAIVSVKPNKESLGRSTLKIETQFRWLAKMAPRKYGHPAG